MKRFNLLIKLSVMLVAINCIYVLAQDNPFIGKWSEKDHADLPKIEVDDLEFAKDGTILNQKGNAIGNYYILKDNFAVIEGKKGKVKFEYQFLESKKLLWLSDGFAVYELKKRNID